MKHNDMIDQTYVLLVIILYPLKFVENYMKHVNEILVQVSHLLVIILFLIIFHWSYNNESMS